jgi:hypothetical protein
MKTTGLRYFLAFAAALSVMGLQGAKAADTTDDVDSMRCGGQLITLGDRELEVVETCGEPDRVRSASYWREVWIYNFGPNTFVRYLTFVDGRLRRIQVGGYGW